MPQVTSAGLLMYRIHDGQLQFLLVHPGGPFFRNKDNGAWTIPKGEVNGKDGLLETAQREFQEELGQTPAGPFTELAPIKQKGGKVVHAWLLQGDCDPGAVVSNTFTIEWPPKSGKQTEFPEVDQACFFDASTAREKVNPAQIPLIDEAERLISLQSQES